jgi:hypothetical protein
MASCAMAVTGLIVKPTIAAARAVADRTDNGFSAPFGSFLLVIRIPPYGSTVGLLLTSWWAPDHVESAVCSATGQPTMGYPHNIRQE